MSDMSTLVSLMSYFNSKEYYFFAGIYCRQSRLTFWTRYICNNSLCV